MKFRWLFLGVVILAGVLFVVQFWHPSLLDSISVLFVILILTLSHHARQMNNRLDRIEAELSKRAGAAPDTEPRGDLDRGSENLGKSLEWRLQNLEKSLEWQIKSSSNDPQQDLDRGFENLEKSLEWRLGNLTIDLENLKKSLEWQIKSLSNDPQQELTEISNRLAALEASFSRLGWQIECMRRVQQISDATHALRAGAAAATFSGEGEPKKEEAARSATMHLLGCIQQESDSFILPFFEGKHLSVLSMQLEKIQKIIQEATLASPALSIEEIKSEAHRILQELDGIHKWAKAIEDEETAKEIGKHAETDGGE